MRRTVSVCPNASKAGASCRPPPSSATVITFTAPPSFSAVAHHIIAVVGASKMELDTTVFMKSVSWVLLSTILGGCATAPEKIKAKHVSPLAYSNLSCDELREEMLRVNSHLDEVAGVQKKTARKDATVMAVGILFRPALFFLAAGEDKEGEIARLKGESEAVASAAIQNNCTYKDELVAAREERAKREKEAQKQQHPFGPNYQ